MLIKPTHQGFIMPTRGSQVAGGWDIYMPEAGTAYGQAQFFGLGFASEIPPGFAALLMPRSGIGAKFGLELNNTTGLIDSDYRGTWQASLKTKSGLPFSWQAGDKLLQYMVVPVYAGEMILAQSLSETGRGTGGFGSTGK